MDIINIINVALTVIGGVSVALGVIAPLTKNVKDDKVLAFLKMILAAVSLNVSDKTLKINSNKASVEVKIKAEEQ